MVHFVKTYSDEYLFTLFDAVFGKKASITGGSNQG